MTLLGETVIPLYLFSVLVAGIEGGAIPPTYSAAGTGN